MSVYFKFLKAVHRQMRDELSFVGIGGWPGIAAERIVIRHVPYRVDDRSLWRDEQTPGIILSPARTIVHGNAYNSHDYYDFPILVQIIDYCEDRSNLSALESWLTWEEQIAKFYHNSNAQREVFDVEGYLFETWVGNTDVFEEQKMDFHHNATMALTIWGRALVGRNAEGSG